MSLQTNLVFLTFTFFFTSCEVGTFNPQKVDLKSNHGPYFIKNSIAQENIATLTDQNKRTIAQNRWQLAIDGAIQANRQIPILSVIDGKRTCLVVVDMQRAFLDSNASIEVSEGRSIIPNINSLSEKVRASGGIVIFFRYLVDSSTVGLLRLFEDKSYLRGNRESPMKELSLHDSRFNIHPGLHVKPNDIIMNKTRYSAVLGSAIVDTLTKYRIENVIVTGVTTDVCAGNTAEGLMQKDFHVVMVWDGTAALDRLEHELYLARIFGLYGDVMPTEEVLMRLK